MIEKISELHISKISPQEDLELLNSTLMRLDKIHNGLALNRQTFIIFVQFDEKEENINTGVLSNTRISYVENIYNIVINDMRSYL